MDTAYIPARRAEKQRSFLNNENPYPAKPRDMIELGVHGGYHFIIGDMPGIPGFGGGISVRKALGHVFSLRAEYTGSFDYGQDYKPYTSYLGSKVSGNPWAKFGGDQFVANYKTATHALSLDLVATLNNIGFYRPNPKVDFYALAGYTIMAADVDVDARDLDYSGVDFGAKKSDIRKQIKDIRGSLYKNFDENAPSQGNRVPIGRMKDNQLLRHGLDAGLGVAFRVSKRFNIAVEQKFTFTFDDYLDGFNTGQYDASKDIFSYSNVRLNFNLGNASKRTEPLYWLNPLDYAYNELNEPRHMKIPPPVLPDADGDGVTDQFDQDPNTPSGVPVDVHGRPLDTDGDGVPDYKDKQLITPTYCQPVDEDGVGKCPDPECCKNMKAACDLGVLPSITFKGRSVSISDDQQALLADVANRMRQSPDCKVVVTGHAEASKASEQLSWDRVNAVITHLTEKEGISGDRFIFQYSGVPGDNHTVDLRTASDADQGPNTVPPPHPNLRRSK
ncbi:hypothetical protein GCM10023143_06740 [Compostibacter hankyongensis]|uniref:OmpA family protein n=2 Tax=Compostibacter hankyongensis TaxID=1007089 RepID=A0ABP8FHB2_9BACT